MRAIWKGSFFSKEERLFLFAEHAIKIVLLNDKISHNAAKRGTRTPLRGIIGLLGLGAELIRGLERVMHFSAAFQRSVESSETQDRMILYTEPLGFPLSELPKVQNTL